MIKSEVSYDYSKLIECTQAMGIELTGEQCDMFGCYYELLTEKNKVMNLTAITEYDEVMIKHFADCLALGYAIDPEKPLDIIDVGTGAGFPGLPLKIAFPQHRMTLMDSLNKRVKFLQEVIDELELEGVEAVHSRAEDGAKNKAYREQFDLCVSRAVANMATLSEYSLPFVKVGGQFIAYKAGDIDEELEAAKPAIKILGGKIKSVKKFTLPGTDFSRSLVVIEKIKPTSGKYPRKAGMPSKEPLGVK